MENRDLVDCLVEIAVESWRFRRVFSKAMQKLDAGEATKYNSQYLWFENKVTKSLETAGLQLNNIEGLLYDTGLPVVPLNLDEFEANDLLFIKQVLEPIIMKDEAVLRQGTVLLGRIGKE